MAKSLRDEIKQTKPFPSLESEALLSLARTAAVLAHENEQLMKAHGLTPTQYNALRILRGAGERGLCGKEIGQRMISPVPDVTRLLDRLEEAGLVGRERDRENRRFVTTRISAAGLRLLEDMDPVVDRLQRERLGHMTEGQLRTLIELTRLVRDPGA